MNKKKTNLTIFKLAQKKTNQNTKNPTKTKN